MDNPFNPVSRLGHGGITMTLVEICHSYAITAYHHDKKPNVYEQVYYATLRKLCPGHPVLQEEFVREMLSSVVVQAMTPKPRRKIKVQYV